MSEPGKCYRCGGGPTSPVNSYDAHGTYVRHMCDGCRKGFEEWVIKYYYKNAPRLLAPAGEKP